MSVAVGDVDEGRRGSLFLVTCLCDEGMTERRFRVIEAESRLAIVESMHRDPWKWRDYLKRSQLWESLHEFRWTPEQLLHGINRSSIDGDSRDQLAIHEITRVETLDKLAVIASWTD